MKPWPQLPSDPRLYYFAVPNEIFRSEINASEFSILAYYFHDRYLLYREDRESYECWPSYRTIGAALCMSRNTVMKYVHRLEEKEFIVTEPTQVRRMDGSKWNGNLKYRIRPIQSVVKRWNEKQAEKAKREQKLLRAMKIAEHRPGFTIQPGIPERRPQQRC